MYRRAQKYGTFKSSVLYPTLQIELNPYFMNGELVKFCLANNISVTSYGPIGAPGRVFKKETEPILLEDPLVGRLAQKYSRTPAQVRNLKP